MNICCCCVNTPNSYFGDSVVSNPEAAYVKSLEKIHNKLKEKCTTSAVKAEIKA